MRKLISIFILLILLCMVGAITLDNISEQEFIFKGINKDNVFTKLISNEADITRGESIFEINNPFKELDLNKTLFFDWYVANGLDYNSYEFYVGVIEIEEKIIPIYENINYTCYKNDNVTNKIIEDICVMSIQSNSKIEKTSNLIWTKNSIVPKGQHMIKFVATWNAHLGPQETDWFPNMNFNSGIFGLPKDINFKKSEWAWFNTSWDYYKEYTNLTGNITYMEISATVNDNSDFNDTRFVSCYDDTLVFNHTLEAKFGTLGQFRVNNLGENCTLRYYGNSEATSTSSASDVYFNPTNAYYLDANANDFVGSNNGTVSGATLSSGYINGSYDFDGSNDYISSWETNTLSDYSIGFWMNIDSLSSVGIVMGFRNSNNGLNGIYIQTQTSGNFYIEDRRQGTVKGLDASAGIVINTWYYVVMTTTKNGYMKLYIDGTLIDSLSGVANVDMLMDSRPFYIGTYNNIGSLGGSYFNGKIDEVLIYDKVLTPTQITQFYTQTSPNFIEGDEKSQIPTDNTPVVNLNSPIDNYNSSSSLITFNGTASDDLNLKNVTFYIDGIINETNSSGINNSNYIFTKTLSEGLHNWTYKVCDNSSQCTIATTRKLVVDTIIPEIYIIIPKNITYSITNLTLEVAGNENLSYCIYSLDNFSTNISMTLFNSTNYRKEVSGFSDGLFRVDFECKDIANNSNTTFEYFTVDTFLSTLLIPEDNFMSPTISNNFSAQLISDGFAIQNSSLYVKKFGENWKITDTIIYQNGNYTLDIYADDLTESDFEINNVNATLISTGVWRINSSNQDYNTQRSQVIKTLFYGTDGSDAAILLATNVSKIVSNDIRDDDVNAFYFKITTNRWAYRIDANFTNSVDNNVSIWTSFQGITGGNGWRLYLELPNDNIVQDTGVLTSSQSFNRIGTNNSNEYYNPGTFESGQGGASVAVSTDNRLLILSKDTINLSFIDITPTTSKTESYVYYNENYSIPSIKYNGLSNFTVNFTEDIDNSADWNIEICNSDGDCEFAVSNRSIYLDRFKPTIDILFPLETSYITDITTVNFTLIDDNPSKCWYSNNSGFTMFEPISVTNGTNYLNITSKIGENIIYVYCNDTRGNQDSDYITYTLDSIRYSSNSDITNTSTTGIGNVFINITVNPIINRQNISFRGFNLTNGSLIQYISDNFTNSTNNTNLNSTTNPFYWDVILYDNNNISYTLSKRYKGTEIVNFSMESTYNNIIVELGADIDINATSNIFNVSIDIDHPDYGVNYITGFLNTSLNLVIDYFRKTTFNDSTTSKALEFIGTEIKTLFFSAHQYDEVDGMSFNISGTNTTQYPENIQINKSNSTEIDRLFVGYLVGNNIYLNTINDGSYNKSLYFSSMGSQIIEFFMDDAANFISMTFKIIGRGVGVDYSDNFTNWSYINISETNATYDGGYLSLRGTNLTTFIYDDFNDSSVNNSLWLFNYGNFNGIIDSYNVVTTLSEVGGYLYMTSSASEDLGTPFCSGSGALLDDSGTHICEYLGDNYNCYLCSDWGTESGCNTFDDSIAIAGFGSCNWYQGSTDRITLNDNIYSNLYDINHFMSNGLSVVFDYYNYGFEKNGFGECSINTIFNFGGENIYTSPLTSCDNGGSSNCNEYSASITPITINISKNSNNSWTIYLNGSEKTYGTNLDNGDCGAYTITYDWDNELKTSTYQYSGNPSCAYTNSVEYLNSTQIINELSISSYQDTLSGDIYSNGYYDSDITSGCNSMNNWLKIYNVNQTLYNRSSGSIISNVIYNSSGDIYSATLNYSTISASDLYYYPESGIFWLSADNGEHWEQAINGQEVSFTYAGNNLRWRIDLLIDENTSNPAYNNGFIKNTAVIKNVSIMVKSGYPQNVSFDLGNDGVIDQRFKYSINNTNSPYTIEINSANLSSAFDGYSTYDHLYEVPLVISSETVGEIFLYDFNITYNPNPISLNISSIQNFLDNSTNFTNFPISIESIGGNITVDDVRYDYAGGNDTIEILIHNDDYSVNISRNITYYYSRWDYFWGPSGVEWIYFAPTKQNSTNVTPYGQTSSIPILNITNFGYGGKDITLSVYQNGTSNCTNVTMSIDNNKSNGFLLNESFIELTNLSYLETATIYMWSDYNCTFDTWNLYEPQYYFRQCVDGGFCSTDLV